METPGLEIVKAFMETERQYQKDIKQLVGEEVVDNNVSSSN